jgi:hypothetical protein
MALPGRPEQSPIHVIPRRSSWILVDPRDSSLAAVPASGTCRLGVPAHLDPPLAAEPERTHPIAPAFGPNRDRFGRSCHGRIANRGESLTVAWCGPLGGQPRFARLDRLRGRVRKPDVGAPSVATSIARS